MSKNENKSFLNKIQKKMIKILPYIKNDKKKLFIKLLFKKIKASSKTLVMKHQWDDIYKTLRNHYVKRKKIIPELDTLENIPLIVHNLINKKDNILKTQLKKKIKKMQGDFVVLSNSYEKYFCELMNWETVNSRYYDCTDGNTHIELKKGQNQMWFDMVRYAEIHLGIGKQDTITLYINYNKKEKKVKEIYVIPTQKIIDFLGMTDVKARICIKMMKSAPRGLNMQASATKIDLREMASYIVKNNNC